MIRPGFRPRLFDTIEDDLTDGLGTMREVPYRGWFQSLKPALEVVFEDNARELELVFSGSVSGELEGRPYLRLDLRDTFYPLQVSEYIRVLPPGQYELTQVTGGINWWNPHWNLAPGTKFETPKLIFGFSPEGSAGASRNLHRYLVDHVFPAAAANRRHSRLMPHGLDPQARYRVDYGDGRAE